MPGRAALSSSMVPGICRADDCADEVVAGLALMSGRPVHELGRDVAIDRPAVGDQVLKLTGGRVAGFDQDKDALLLAGCDLDEWDERRRFPGRG